MITQVRVLSVVLDECLSHHELRELMQAMRQLRHVADLTSREVADPAVYAARADIRQEVRGMLADFLSVSFDPAVYAARADIRKEVRAMVADFLTVNFDEEMALADDDDEDEA